ncbi:MAG: hypothetical protein NC402_02565 [Prevotella sp.]|nr:hypothetical protein [Prevotella sp.]MCM1074848.1 hypothetical protein [Ruminococcus sp.]
MKKPSLYISALAALWLLTACGDTQIEHCTNEYDPVEKGNVDSLNAEKGEVVSEIPEAGEAEKVLDEAKKEQGLPQDSLNIELSTAEYDENGELIAPEQGAEISLSEQAELEVIGEVKDKNRRTSEEAKREQAERERKALEEMGE